MTNQTKEELKKAFREVADRANNFTTYVTMSGSYVLNPEPIADYFIDQFDNIINEKIERIEKLFTEVEERENRVEVDDVITILK